jgi:NADH:ubiquinone oxidoreductase subunit C
MEFVYISNYLRISWISFLNSVFVERCSNVLINFCNFEDTAFLWFFEFVKKDFNLVYSSLVDNWAMDTSLLEPKIFNHLGFGDLNLFYRIFSSSHFRTTVTIFFSVFKSYKEVVIRSITSIFESANWLEREIWDLFGVFFVGNPDLRRILTDYGFFGHPLRKSFPLTGFYEIRFDEKTQKISSEKINTSQIFRNFFTNKENPWK